MLALLFTLAVLRTCCVAARALRGVLERLLERLLDFPFDLLEDAEREELLREELPPVELPEKLEELEDPPQQDVVG